jgi:hypothetical protein
MLEASNKMYGPDHWAEQEFGRAKLGDRRLLQRLKQIAARFAEQPSASIPKSCSGWAQTKAAYRFFAHPEIRSEALLEPHQERTRERCTAEPLVFVVQDTTGLTYGERAGLGLVGSGADGVKGLWLHSSMAFTEQGRALGLVRAEHWRRDPAGFGKAARRHERPTAEKESQRWLNSFNDCVKWAQAAPATRWVNVADREADIYELFVTAAPHPEVGVLVRARHNRKTTEGADLDEVIRTTPLAGRVEVAVPRKPGAFARTAYLEVRYAQVKVKAPTRGQGEGLTLWIVEAREASDKAGAIYWRLLTNLPVENLEAALEKIKWYRLRWQIEEYHRILKSGCQAQARQLETGDRLIKVLMLDIIVAWRVLELSRAARQSQAEALQAHFCPEEIEVIQKHRAHSSHKEDAILSLREAVRAVAQMGGFLGRKGDGEPGAMTLWRGLEVLANLVLGWRLAKTCG